MIMKTSRDDVIQLQQGLDVACLSSLPFAAIADSPNVLLERILVDEIFFSSRSFMMWDVQLRRLSDGFLVKLSQSAQAYPS
jgi:hypothetical protein